MVHIQRAKSFPTVCTGEDCPICKQCMVCACRCVEKQTKEKSDWPAYDEAFEEAQL